MTRQPVVPRAPAAAQDGPPDRPCPGLLRAFRRRSMAAKRSASSCPMESLARTHAHALVRRFTGNLRTAFKAATNGHEERPSQPWPPCRLGAADGEGALGGGRTQIVRIWA